MESQFPPISKPRRQLFGASAILLPFEASGEIDWAAFEAHVARTAAAGLTPAVNMDTGYAHLLSDEQRVAVLDRTQQILSGGSFYAGTVVGDQLESPFDLLAYTTEAEKISSRCGTPVVFQSYGLTSGDDAQIVERYAQIGESCGEFIGFELGQMFAPFGKVYSLQAFRQIVQIPQCIGLKHSSLSRELEWQRLEVRDAVRPEFRLFTGNDLAIDMVMYGSDYLLGLSTFAPEAFALRDRYWQEGDHRFYELNDVLQYLGALAFREPVPAYKHDAAMFLNLRGWTATDLTHIDSPKRPASDREILAGILRTLEIHLEA